MGHLYHSPIPAKVEGLSCGGVVQKDFKSQSWGGRLQNIVFWTQKTVEYNNSQRLRLLKTCTRLSHPKSQHVLGRSPTGPTT